MTGSEGSKKDEESSIDRLMQQKERARQTYIDAPALKNKAKSVPKETETWKPASEGLGLSATGAESTDRWFRKPGPGPDPVQHAIRQYKRNNVQFQTTRIDVHALQMQAAASARLYNLKLPVRGSVRRSLIDG